MVVELRMQYCGQVHQDSFETYKTFLRCIITEFVRKVDFQNRPFGGYVLGIVFLKLLNKDDKKCKKKSTSWKKIGATLFNLPSFFKSLFYKNSQLKIYMYEDDSFFRSINNHLKLFLTKEIPFYLKYGNIYILITETSSVIYSLNFCNSVTF